MIYGCFVEMPIIGNDPLWLRVADALVVLENGDAEVD